MAYDDDKDDTDDRTIYVGNLSDKMTDAVLSELFLQAGPLERVSIPKEKDGKNKNFGFITYKHLISVSYALNIFAGTRLFGRELLLKNRNGNRNREQGNHTQQPSMSLVHGYNRGSNVGLPPTVQLQQDLLQQQFLAATGQQLVVPNFASAAANMFAGSSNPYGDYASARSDNAGSHRESYVDRNRHHRDEGRNHRDKPYRRSRSPQRSHRSRSPQQHRSRGSRHQEDRSNYHRWGKR